MTSHRVRFDAFEFDAAALELFRSGERLRIQHKPLRVLAALLERRAELVTREELRARLWAQSRDIDFENNLNAAVRKLREALGDSSVQPRYIETLPGRGYRFIGHAEASECSLPRGYRMRAGQLRRAVPWLSATAVALALIGAIVIHQPGNSAPAAVAVMPFQNLSGELTQDHVAQGLTAELTAQFGVHGSDRARLIGGPGRHRSPDFIVTGSSRRDATGLFVTASLKRRSGEQLWAEAYFCPRHDLFAVQRQIATKIGQRVLAELSADAESNEPGRR